jgi:hypothetical protein
MIMELKDYSTEELKAELKRRTELAKAQKQEEMKNAAKCRNCKHLMNHPQFKSVYLCGARTWGKTYTRHYCVKLFNTCEKFERKE